LRWQHACRHIPIGEDAVNEGEDTAGGFQKRSAAVAILDTRRMRFEHEAAPIGIDERVALSAFDLFAGVIAARRFAVERRGHLWKGLIARSRGEITDTPERLFGRKVPGTCGQPENLRQRATRNPRSSEIALRLRKLLQPEGLDSWRKTTGGKGLHLMVPDRPHQSRRRPGTTAIGATKGCSPSVAKLSAARA
jgi:hypothetical protein